MTEQTNLYKLLQVDPAAETKIIRYAYRYLASKYRPDKQTTGDRDMFDLLTAAWKILGDETSRAAYDQSLKDNEQFRCSFCGKSKDRVAKLIAGPGVFICNECVELCNEIISDSAGFHGNPGKKCSFCAFTQESTDTKRVIAGPGVFICDECLALCNEILASEFESTGEHHQTPSS